MVSHNFNQAYCKVCKQCGQKIQQIPMRNYNSLIILELYCPNCDISEIKYETIEV
jgi:hypothetical protein